MRTLTTKTWAAKIHKDWSALKHKKKLLAALVITLSIITPMELTISGEFEVYPKHNADVRAPVEAVISEIFVREGEAVEEGQVLFQLVNPDYEAKKQDIQLRLAQARSRYALMVAGTRSEEIDLAQKEVETARSRLEHSQKMIIEAKVMRDQKVNQARQSVTLTKDQLQFAETEQERFRALLAKGIISQQRFAEADQVVKVRLNALNESQSTLRMALADDTVEIKREGALASGALEEAGARLDLLLAGSRGEEREAAKSAVTSLTAQLSLIDQDIESMSLRSPEYGIVVTQHLHELKGQLVRRGALIAEVYDFHIIKAEILIPEKEIGDIVIGQKVTLKARAYSGRSFIGKVVAIAPRAVESEDGLRRKMLRVTTVIDNPDLALKPAMTGHGKIYAGQRSILNLITRRLMSYLRVEFWSWW